MSKVPRSSFDHGLCAHVPRQGVLLMPAKSWSCAGFPTFCTFIRSAVCQLFLQRMMPTTVLLRGKSAHWCTCPSSRNRRAGPAQTGDTGLMRMSGQLEQPAASNSETLPVMADHVVGDECYVAANSRPGQRRRRMSAWKGPTSRTADRKVQHDFLPRVDMAADILLAMICKSARGLSWSGGCNCVFFGTWHHVCTLFCGRRYFHGSFACVPGSSRLSEVLKRLESHFETSARCHSKQRGRILFSLVSRAPAVQSGLHAYATETNAVPEQAVEDDMEQDTAYPTAEARTQDNRSAETCMYRRRCSPHAKRWWLLLSTLRNCTASSFKPLQGKDFASHVDSLLSLAFLSP